MKCIQIPLLPILAMCVNAHTVHWTIFTRNWEAISTPIGCWTYCCSWLISSSVKTRWLYKLIYQLPTAPHFLFVLVSLSPEPFPHPMTVYHYTPSYSGAAQRHHGRKRKVALISCCFFIVYVLFLHHRSSCKFFLTTWYPSCEFMVVHAALSHHVQISTRAYCWKEMIMM